MPVRLNAGATGFDVQFAEFLQIRQMDDQNVDAVVADILADVKKRGDGAVLDYTKRFDRLELEQGDIRIEPARVSAARHTCPSDAVSALETAATRIRTYHEKLLPQDFEDMDGSAIGLGARWTPIESVGLYVPGGTAAYPSSVLMNAIPAKVAGVDRLVMVVPTPDGTINDLVLAAAEIAGVDEIYRIGGAQAVGALAYGTETIARVDKIVGPGNAYVASAKKQVFGTVGIDMIAGPSEILVVADALNHPEWIAADLLSQAEHDRVAQSILMTDEESFADAVEAEITNFLKTLPRAEIARASWEEFGAIIVLENLDDAPQLVNKIAPEHLELAVSDPDRLADEIRHAGAIFFGRYAPEALGDYLAGPNHVLPTSGTARFSSGLGTADFMKRTSLIRCGEAGLAAVGPQAITLAEAEGLDAHALSIAIRLKG